MKLLVFYCPAQCPKSQFTAYHRVNHSASITKGTVTPHFHRVLFYLVCALLICYILNVTSYPT